MRVTGSVARKCLDGASRWALALGACGVGALASGPAHACFFISGGAVQFNSMLSPPCPAGFFDNFGAAQAALQAMMGSGGPTTSPTPPPSATPTAPTTAATLPGGTTITSDNVQQILGSTLFLTPPEAFFELRTPIVPDFDPGSGSTIFAYNVGGTWAPVRDIRFRGNYRRAVRAPTLAELFSPPSELNESLGTFKIAENESPRPRDRVFVNYSYFDGLLPTTGTGRSAAGFAFDSGVPEIEIRFDGVADNGLQYGASVKIPVEKPADPSAPADPQSELGKFAMLLFTDEAPGQPDAQGDRFDFFSVGSPDAARFPYDVEAARALLEEAGWAEDDGDRPPVASEARLSGGVAFLGEGASGGKTLVAPHALEVSGRIRNTQFTFDAQFFTTFSGELAGPPTSAGAPVVDLFAFGAEDQPQGVRYVADLGLALSEAATACPAGLCGEPRKLDIKLDDGRGVSLGFVHQVAAPASGGVPDLIISEFGFAPGGPVQGTMTLFTAPPQPSGLPPVRLPVVQGEGSGADLRQAIEQAAGALPGAGTLPRPLTTGGSLGRSELGGGLIPLRSLGGRAPWLELDEGNLGPGYRLPGESLVSFSLDVFSVFSAQAELRASPAQIQPDGSAASMLFGEAAVGGLGVTSNGAQFAASLQLSEISVVTPAEPRGTLTGQPLRSLGGGPTGDFDADMSRFFLDVFISDPAGGRGAANAGAPPQAGAAPAAQPGHASGQVRIGARDGVGAGAPQPGQLRANVIGQGVVPNGPTYGVRIDIDPAQAPGQPGATGILGQAGTSILNNVVSANFDVDVRGAERLAERACGGIALDCGGSVRNVTFSFNAPGAAPIVDVALGLDAVGRPAPRGAEPGLADLEQLRAGPRPAAVR
jgi:hypothetical protein